MHTQTQNNVFLNLKKIESWLELKIENIKKMFKKRKIRKEEQKRKINALITSS